MQLSLRTYIPRNSCIHRVDARVKLVLLLAYSIALFFIDTWWGMGVATALFLLVFFLSRLPARRIFGIAWPVYVLAGLSVAFNSFLYGVPTLPNGEVDTALVPLIAGFHFTPAGCLRGCFFGLRILLLVFASLVVCFSTTTTQLTNALNSFLSPLRRLKVPTDDIATVISIALRFIPVTAEEFNRVRDAQWLRGASFYEGSIFKRLKAWQTTLIPLFVGLFRRADRLALAMDARCYGVAARRTSWRAERFEAGDWAIVIVGMAIFVFVAAFW